MQTKIFIFIIILTLVFEACSSTPRFTSRRDTIQEEETKNEKIKNEEIKNGAELSEYDNYPVLETQTGIASFYAEKYHGKITYGGEVYDMNGISAAHHSYQMNTIIRITNLENNRKVILRINDKMPQWPNRIIDVSLGTAKELDFIAKGLVNVKIEVLEWGNGRK